MKLLFVHGWNVWNMNSYGRMPEALQAAAPDGMELDIHDIFLGRYINFHDEVTLDDVARGFDEARKEKIGDDEFSCITHSTGGPVVRLWAHLFYGENGLAGIPLRHLIMLAPANHGSPLAALGQKRASRLFKKLWDGVESGTGLLKWLQLGSKEQMHLNMEWMNYAPAENHFYPFVLTGETIDTKFYDFINNYLVEPGSDGVVRVCGANMNYQHIKLVQNGITITGYDDVEVSLLEPQEDLLQSPPAPMAVIKGASHSGDEIGIMRSATEENYEDKPVVARIIDCLSVDSVEDYDTASKIFDDQNKSVQCYDDGTPNLFCSFAFRVWDDRGNSIDDFDMLLLAREDYNPSRLPKDFFQDRQFNESSKTLTYYLNYTNLIEASHFGFRIAARPDSGFSYYKPVEFRSNGHDIKDIIKANQTFIVDVVLKRIVDQEIFRFKPATEDRDSDFRKVKPSGKIVP